MKIEKNIKKKYYINIIMKIEQNIKENITKYCDDKTTINIKNRTHQQIVY